jgi:hypothetical protein
VKKFTVMEQKTIIFVKNHHFNTHVIFFSDLIIDVAGEISRPLEEYMGFARNKTEKVVAFNAAGVKSGYCAAFAVVEKVTQNLIPTLTNVSMVFTLKLNARIFVTNFGHCSLPRTEIGRTRRG